MQKPKRPTLIIKDTLQTLNAQVDHNKWMMINVGTETDFGEVILNPNQVEELIRFLLKYASGKGAAKVLFGDE